MPQDITDEYPDSKVHGANMGPTWGRQDPGGPHDSHVNLAIWLTNIALCDGLILSSNTPLPEPMLTKL